MQHASAIKSAIENANNKFTSKQQILSVVKFNSFVMGDKLNALEQLKRDAVSNYHTKNEAHRNHIEARLQKKVRSQSKNNKSLSPPSLHLAQNPQQT